MQVLLIKVKKKIKFINIKKITFLKISYLLLAISQKMFQAKKIAQGDLINKEIMVNNGKMLIYEKLFHHYN